jgi:hypothetical protein
MTSSPVLSKPSVNLWSRSRIRKRNDSGRSASVHVSCRACFVTNGALRFAVQPATCTRRLPSSMKKNTYSCCSHRLDCEEIDGEQASAVRSDELAPCHLAACAGRSDTRCPKSGAHRRRGHRPAKALQFAGDALITPPRVVSRETEDQRSDLPANRRAPGLTRLRPQLRDQAAMPPKQGRRRHDEGTPAGAREDSAGRPEEDPVGPRHRRTTGSSPEDAEFVPQHDDFQILELPRPKN